jgi:osmotically-inducible protein OsmY
MQVAGSARTFLNLTEPAMANPRNYLMWAFLVVFLGVAAACAPTPERRAAGEFVDDATLTARVKTALAKEEGIKGAAEINVDTYRGVVSLSGFVDNQAMINGAAAAARRVEGVKNVVNNLRVKPPR